MFPNEGHNSVDGFAVRRRSSANGDIRVSKNSRPGIKTPSGKEPAPHLEKTFAAATSVGHGMKSQKSVRLSRSEIDDSLNAVDDEGNFSKAPRRRFGRVTKKKVAIVIFLIILAFVGYFVVKFMSTSRQVFSGNIFDLLGSGTQLKTDEKEWTNILVFGTSEDDPGHAGATLTDSIMVVSLHQKDKKVAMVSMPRDLWVDYGQACMAGYSGKINALYSCGVDSGGEAEGVRLLRQKVGEVFGLDIHYYAKVNYSLVRDLTTSLGGVTVDIKSSDPRGIYDYNTKLKLPNGESTIEGEQALAFVRARGDGGGYGFEGSNFMREKNQQAMILAIRNKALSAGTLANPVAWNGMLDAMGNNIRSDFSAAEIKTLVKFAEDVKPENIIQISLVEEGKEVVTTGSINGASIVRPVAGVSDFSAIIKYISRKMNASASESAESASIEILNASNKSGIAAKKQTELESAGFDDVSIGDTSFIIPETVRLYDTTSGKSPKILALLEKQLGVTSLGSTLPVGVQSEADFVILLGDGTN